MTFGDDPLEYQHTMDRANAEYEEARKELDDKIFQKMYAYMIARRRFLALAQRVGVDPADYEVE
jgi:hypothetical protein